jgi:cell pole-organizing protein PopZ
MTQAAKAQEPSMEEILASIRRIIADDDENKNAAEPQRTQKTAAPPGPKPVPTVAAVTPVPDLDAGPAAEPVTDDSEILDLTEPVSPPAKSAVFRTIDAAQDLVFDETKAAPEKEPEPEVPVSASVAPAAEADSELRAFDAGAATAAAARRQFERESEDERSLLSTTTTAAVDSAFNALAQTVLVQNSRTLDDLVREMLRPMLKSWLDDNLPSLVERLVRAEIDRVSRGRA